MNQAEKAYLENLIKKIDQAINYKVSPFHDDPAAMFEEKMDVCVKMLGDIKNDIQIHVRVCSGEHCE